MIPESVYNIIIKELFLLIWHENLYLYKQDIKCSLVTNHFSSLKEKFGDTKGVIRANRKSTDNKMAERKGGKRQTMIYKTLHRKLKIVDHKPY
jgi:hypothetical protein